MASHNNEMPFLGASSPAALSKTLRDILEQPENFQHPEPASFNLPKLVLEPTAFYKPIFPEAYSQFGQRLPLLSTPISKPMEENTFKSFTSGTLPAAPLRSENRVSEPSHQLIKALNKSSDAKQINPAHYYQPLPYAPTSWPLAKKIFKYTAFGELSPRIRYTPDQIVQFIRYHYGNIAEDGTCNGKTSSLSLWIQDTPADSSRRYPTRYSDKCRFNCCPVINNHISPGTVRVAFDESISSGLHTDPYHCAGYVHLYCLEKFTPFSAICANFNVRPDTRIFREGPNKMAITRDHEIFAAIVEKYIQLVSAADFDHDRKYDYKRTLCHKLVKTHMAERPKAYAKTRKGSSMNGIDRHMGDLTMYAEEQHVKQALRRARKTSMRKSQERGSPDLNDIFGPQDSKS